VAVLTISDAGVRGDRRDTSGDAIVKWVETHGWDVAERSIVADEQRQIADTLVRWADGDKADLVLTTGGTGLTERDVTPEATSGILERAAPGIAEAIRSAAVPRFPRAALSRGVAGVRRRTLIINLPGSPGGVRDGLAVLDGIAEHAVELVRGTNTSHE
jgi:molybdenum cofactor synthesis domain-containing protein